MLLLYLLLPALLFADTKTCVRVSRRNPQDAAGCGFVEGPLTNTHALIEVRGKYIAVIGESTLRQEFEQLSGLLHDTPAVMVVDEKDKKVQLVRPSNAVLRFSYEPYFANLTAWLQRPVTWFDRPPDLVVMQAGLHDILYNEKKFEHDFNNLVQEIRKNPKISILFQTMAALDDDRLKDHRKEATQFRSKNVEAMNNKMETALRSLPNIYIQDLYVPYEEDGGDGVHSMSRARTEAEGIVQALHVMNNDPSAFEAKDWTAGQVMFFIIYGLIVATVIPAELMTRFFQPKYQSLKLQESNEGDAELGNAESDRKGVIVPSTMSFLEQPLDLYMANREAFRAALIFSSVVFTIFLMDGPFWRPFNPALKEYNRDFFIFLHIGFLTISYLTLSPTFKNKDSVLGRNQTGEWKGIMQIVFVMYHYFDAREIYNLIRVFIAAYVWMTGWGNTIYFTKKRDPTKPNYCNPYSWNRLFQMLFRLNWLVFWVCLVLDQPLMLYYICPLHTFFFLFTFFVCWAGNQYNDSNVFFGFKLAASFVFLFLLFDVEGVFEVVFSPMSWLLNFYGSLHEWKFRATLDHYQTWFGIISAFMMPHLQNVISYAEKQPFTKHLMTKSILIGPWLVAASFWYNSIYPRDKFAYNKIHPYTAFIPVITYILLRNSIQSTRRWYSSFLSWLGDITLETYIFQYHIYLQDDAKSIIILFEGYPLCNFVILSCSYCFFSKLAYDSTQVLKVLCFPADSANWTDKDNVKRFFVMALALAGFYVLAHGIILITGLNA